ncbi:MAG: manganese-dependent inorganic pyrophosphatase [Candidatus Nanohaloarchaeota archaeon QJJ-7]|nr:manganese-dependent inorganic pyrophosphatase [Candidatus Nanohaloarchaeota archaeon QJJ-7]
MTGEPEEEEKHYIVGHKQPDTDTIVSAIAYSRLQEASGRDAVAVRAGDLNPETEFVLEKFDVDEPELLEDASGKSVIMVDHNVYSQAVEGMEDAKVRQVIDHHRLGDIETSEPIYVRIEPVGSTATIITDMYLEAGVEIDRKTSGLLLSGLLSDTVVLRSPTTTDVDRRVAGELAERAGVDYEEYGKEILSKKSEIGEKSPREMILGDFKEYDWSGETVGIGQVETVEPEKVLEQKETLIDTMEDIGEERGYPLLVLLITDLLEEHTEAFAVGKEKDRFEDALETEMDDSQASLPGVMSRKKQVVPPLEESFQG